MVALILVLAITLSTVFGALCVAVMNRSGSRRTGGSFRCKVHLASGSAPWLRRKGRARRFQGSWVHEVLVLRRGWFVLRCHHVPVQSAEGVLAHGAGTVIVRFRLDA